MTLHRRAAFGALLTFATACGDDTSQSSPADVEATAAQPSASTADGDEPPTQSDVQGVEPRTDATSDGEPSETQPGDEPSDGDGSETSLLDAGSSSETPALDADSTELIAWRLADPENQIEVGSIRVPVDYLQPEGEQLALAMLRRRVPATERTGVIMFNGGGPGPGTLIDYPWYLEMLNAVAPTLDVVLVDNRGTGLSTPIECQTLAEYNAHQAEQAAAADRVDGGTDDELAFSDGGVALEQEVKRKLLLLVGAAKREFQTLCLETYGERLQYFNTENVARDMEVVRVAMGEEKLNFWGISYGTVQGALYAKMYPNSVGAFVLDSPVLRTSTGPNYVQSLQIDALAYETELNRFFQWAGTDPDSALYDGNAQTPARVFDELVVTLGDGVTALGEELSPTLIPALSTTFLRQGAWAPLAELFAEANAGNWEPFIANEDTDGLGTADEDAYRAKQANNVLNPMEYGCPANFDIDTALAEYETLMAAAPRLGWFMGLNIGECLGWDLHPAEPQVIPQALQSPPLLVVSGLHDPATGHANGVGLVEQFANGSWLLTSGLEGHGLGGSSPCTSGALLDFFQHADVSTLPDECDVTAPVASLSLRRSTRSVERIASARLQLPKR